MYNHYCAFTLQLHLLAMHFSYRYSGSFKLPSMNSYNIIIIHTSNNHKLSTETINLSQFSMHRELHTAYIQPACSSQGPPSQVRRESALTKVRLPMRFLLTLRTKCVVYAALRVPDLEFTVNVDRFLETTRLQRASCEMQFTLLFSTSLGVFQNHRRGLEWLVELVKRIAKIFIKRAIQG